MSLFRGQAPNVEITETLQNGAATAANYGVFFIADSDYEIVEARESHTTAGNDAGTVSLNVEKLTGTQAPDGGSTVLAAAFNLKGTANTVQTKSGSNKRISKGDRLCLKDAGVLTSLVGVSVSVTLRPMSF